MAAHLDRLLPRRALQGQGPEKHVQARLVVAASILCAAAGLVGAGVAALQGVWAGAWISLLASALWALTLPTLWLTGSIRAAGSWIPLGIFLDLGGQVALVCDQSLSLVFLFVVPLAALLLLGTRDGWFWTAVTVASAWPLAQLHSERVQTLSMPAPTTAWATVAFTLVIFGVFRVNAWLRARALSEADEARLRAEEVSRRLAEEQARFRAISESSFQTLTETDRRGIVRYVNPRFAEVLGYSAEEMIGRHPGELLAELPPEGTPPVDEVMESGSRYEVQSRHRDGHLLWQEVVATRYVTPEGEERWIFAGRDITHEKAERERLQEAQRLESLGVLAGGVAHDFNNLLTVIAGYAEGLPQTEAATEIRRATRRAASLTSHLLAFGRKQILLPRVTTLDEQVGELSQMLQSLVREEVKLVLDLQSADCCVELDPNQFQRVLVNLASNARDAMRAGGVLRISTRPTELDEEEAKEIGVPAGPYARLTMSDTGTGMEAETRERAFDPFFTTKEIGAGTGLGLASVYGIVEQSRGGIQLESWPDCGTEVTVFVPRVEDIRQRAPLDAVPADGSDERANGRGRRILLVEDEHSVRRLVASTLRKEGYEVLEASDGPSAIAVVADSDAKLDLLISDVVMPGMRGPELATRLRRDRPELPALFISGYTDRQLGLTHQESPPSRLLTKPFAPDAVSAARCRP
jgi:PAS domain S-box-containing protein